MKGGAPPRGARPGAVICALCGHAFREGMQSCAACPLPHGCRITCCPRCGYAMAGRSVILDLTRRIGRALARLFKGAEGARGGTP